MAALGLDLSMSKSNGSEHWKYIEHCTFRHIIGLSCPELGGAAVDTDDEHEQKCRGKWVKMFSRMPCNGIFVNFLEPQL